MLTFWRRNQSPFSSLGNAPNSLQPQQEFSSIAQSIYSPPSILLSCPHFIVPHSVVHHCHPPQLLCFSLLKFLSQTPNLINSIFLFLTCSWAALHDWKTTHGYADCSQFKRISGMRLSLSAVQQTFCSPQVSWVPKTVVLHLLDPQTSNVPSLRLTRSWSDCFCFLYEKIQKWKTSCSFFHCHIHLPTYTNFFKLCLLLVRHSFAAPLESEPWPHHLSPLFFFILTAGILYV